LLILPEQSPQGPQIKDSVRHMPFDKIEVFIAGFSSTSLEGSLRLHLNVDLT
jgi:hypothetical protein